MAEEKILIVDDEEHIRELIKFNLDKNGYKTICADNGLDALKMAKDEKSTINSSRCYVTSYGWI